MVAARTDPALREHLSVVVYRILETVRETFVELFPAEAAGSPLGEIAPWFAIAVMDGLALGQLAIPHEETVAKMLTALKQIAALMLPGSLQEARGQTHEEA
jgi:hypothetical protein